MVQLSAPVRFLPIASRGSFPVAACGGAFGSAAVASRCLTIKPCGNSDLVAGAAENILNLDFMAGRNSDSVAGLEGIQI